VKTGWRLGGRIQILEGLAQGEEVVTSGTFLVDSETRMAWAAKGFTGPPAIDPICGMEVDRAKAKAAGRVSDRDGRTFYFCSDDCKRDFEGR